MRRATRVFETIAAGLVAAALGAPVPGARAQAPDFSLDAASQSLGAPLTADDVMATGPVVATAGTALGLLDGTGVNGPLDDLDALSYGQDPIGPPIFFSVDRVSFGIDESPVQFQANMGEASGDVFRSLPPTGGKNALFIDEGTLGLVAGTSPPEPRDDLNALELDTAPSPFFYFSISKASGSAVSGGVSPADILFSDGSGAFGVYADAIQQVGLQAGDDIDALVLMDVGLDGVADGGVDRALFSLSPLSPSLGATGTPADIFITDFEGAFILFLAPADIGLTENDNIDALDTMPPRAIPEPAGLGLLGLGLAALGALRRRRGA